MREDTEKLVRTIIEKVLLETSQNSTLSNSENRRLVPAEISGRHLHISRADLDILFGPGYQLKKLKDLSQPNQFASEETVRLVGPKRVLERVRILGPCRKSTQVEISRTDSFYLGIKPVIRISGETSGTPGVLIVGPKGFVSIPEGVIISKCHLHIEDPLADTWGLKSGDLVDFKVPGERSIVFKDVVVRRGPGHKLALHLDTDEGNAANLNTGDLVELITS